jgi:hypothetical protein
MAVLVVLVPTSVAVASEVTKERDDFVCEYHHRRPTTRPILHGTVPNASIVFAMRMRTMIIIMMILMMVVLRGRKSHRHLNYLSHHHHHHHRRRHHRRCDYHPNTY